MRVLKWMAENWVKIALTVATAIYLPFAYGLIKDTGACAPPIAEDHPYWEFYYRYLACREVNEVGDTFAGFFAPLAFIWLAGAVYIQSQELAAQRAELDETQAVMREQLEVARQQVEETRATTSLLKEQGEAVGDERRRQTALEADTAFNAMKDRFVEEVNNRGRQHLVFHHAGIKQFAFDCPFGSEKLARPTFERCIADLKEQVREIEAARETYRMELFECDIEALRSLTWDLKRMLAHLPKTSLATKIRAEGYVLPVLIAVIDWMISSYEEVLASLDRPA